MNEMKTMGLRLPVQVAVDRTTAYGTLADGHGCGRVAGSRWSTGAGFRRHAAATDNAN